MMGTKTQYTRENVLIVIYKPPDKYMLGGVVTGGSLGPPHVKGWPPHGQTIPIPK